MADLKFEIQIRRVDKIFFKISILLQINLKILFDWVENIEYTNFLGERCMATSQINRGKTPIRNGFTTSMTCRDPVILWSGLSLFYATRFRIG